MSGQPSHVDSLYAAQVPEAARWPSLIGAAETETCVIGGGLAGLTVARELARRGRPIVLVEAGRIGWAASGRNGGFVSPGFARGLFELEDRLGRDHARALFDLSLGGVRYVRDTLAETGAGNVIAGEGWLKLYRYADPAGVRRRIDRMRRDYGITYEEWSRERIAATLATTRYVHGLHDPTAFHVDPLAYAHVLAGSATKAGAMLLEGTRADRLDRSDGGWRVTTPAGVVNARHVVLAGNTDLGTLYPALQRAILPIATYVVASAPLGQQLHATIGFGGCIADTRRAGDYYRKVRGDRLLWGGRITTRRSEPRQLAAMLARDIAAIYPDLADLPVEHAWMGTMGYAIHKMPILGLLEPGLWSATAFGGHGLNTTAMGGRLIAGAIAEGDDRWRLFAPFTARWGGGAVGRVATQLEYWRLKALDRWDEARRAAA